MASSMISTTIVSRSTLAQANMVAPFTGLKSIVAFPSTHKNVDITSIASNGGRVSCMKREQLIKEVECLLHQKLIPCFEFELEGTINGRYWTMWKLQMFGCTDAVEVMNELDEAIKAYPNDFFRIIEFDNIRQVQCISFIAYKPPGY
ncbi:hypothetical protein BUALT_Bualt02G0075400 [Buddleja alternifolia]|uniref:Ribulose bisphosphate carboxylase small subunit n=1 Tax=Buddleja alternifolia TaxID=168488 RepID=A0AAV6XYS4_9LAMI|nr:hypothetical protein BUALT_Bualt02G0075400 [Buddleja alternifolia]